MSNEEILALKKQRETEALSQLIRARLLAMELGAVVMFQDFRTGLAVLRFVPETLERFDLPKAEGVC